jgi:hypothetical protein
MISKTQVIEFLYIISNLINVTSIDGTKQPTINKILVLKIVIVMEWLYLCVTMCKWLYSFNPISND